MNVLDLFSGIGGFSLGLERAGMRTIAFCEIEPFCRAVLRKHWPDVPQYNDVRTLTAERLKQDGIGPIDLICGGFPCPDISIAGINQSGGRLGLDGYRSGLWEEQRRIIGDFRPSYALVENVSAILSGDNGAWLGRLLRDLAEIGYDAEWHCIPASAVGAPHRRDRIWIVAYPNSKGVERSRTPIYLIKAGAWGWDSKRDFQALCDAPFEPRNNRWPQPIIRRMDDGIRNRVERLRAMGNAVVPQIPEIIGKAILEAERLTKCE